MTLHENVRIEQRDGETTRRATGDELSILFSSESEGLGNALALGPRVAVRETWLAAGPRPGRATDLLLAAVLAVTDEPERAIAPAPAPGDTVITCDGGLTMVPVSRKEGLPSPRDARLDLVGAPVRIVDEAAVTVATCARVRYHLQPGRLELLADDTHPLDIASPQLDARGERFWIVRRDDAAGFTGPGAAAFRAADDEAARERLRIAWSERADLAFRTDPGRSRARLERASFAGDVDVVSSELRLDAAAGDGAAPAAAAEGRLQCRRLAIEFRLAAPAAAGSPDAAAPRGDGPGVEPASLRATGRVVVDDGSRELRAETLDAWFTERAAGSDSDLDRLVAVTDVRLRLAGGERVYADRLEVNGAQRTAVVSGREVRLVDGPNVLDRAELITLDDAARRYTLIGKGRLRRFDGPVIPDAEAAVADTMFDHVEGRTEELRVTWHEGVEFLDGGEGGALGAGSAGLARFTGDVAVLSPELRLTHADELVVRFGEAAADGGAPEAASRQLESITARGDVHARSAGDQGEIRAEHLHVDLRTSAAGATVPERLVAAGGVHVADAQQQMWTEVLTATFREVAARGEDEAAAPGAPGEFAGARVAVDAVSTEGGVQVLLAGGERAFADRLVASGARETAELLGQRVMVVAGSIVLDECRRLVLDRGSARHRVEGPGLFYQIADPMPGLAVDGPVTRPEIDAPRTIEATWTESATYTETDGGGALELRGNVHGESRPSAIEFSTIDADAATLEFRDGAPVTGDEPTRELARLVATGRARLENRTWQTPDRQGLPRVFHVAGDRVDYDQRTLEALVVGEGELLIRDEWAVDEDDGPGLGVGFGSRGTTLFRWNEKLHMRQVVDDRFTILMNGDVECLHRDLEGRASLLTGQVLEATVARSGVVAEPAPSGGGRPGGLRLGGSMKPKRLYGRGGIFIRTPERDVTCDEFAYNLMTGMAEVNAAPGRMVFIHSGGTTAPMRHQRVLWDMRNDTITIYRGGG